MMAIGAMVAIREAGLRVPDDIAVAGFDDITVARLLNPPLTTVAQFPERLGRRAAEMLFARLDGSVTGEGRASRDAVRAEDSGVGVTESEVGSRARRREARMSCRVANARKQRVAEAAKGGAARKRVCTLRRLNCDRRTAGITSRRMHREHGLGRSDLLAPGMTRRGVLRGGAALGLGASHSAVPRRAGGAAQESGEPVDADDLARTANRGPSTRSPRSSTSTCRRTRRHRRARRSSAAASSTRRSFPR